MCHVAWNGPKRQLGSPSGVSALTMSAPYWASSQPAASWIGYGGIAPEPDNANAAKRRCYGSVCQ